MLTLLIMQLVSTGGFMESLDNHWILQGNVQQCEQFEKMPNTLGLENMAGVFIVVGVGIGGGVGLIIIEMAYKKHQIRKQRKMELARHAADKWRGMIEVIQSSHGESRCIMMHYELQISVIIFGGEWKVSKPLLSLKCSLI